MHCSFLLFYTLVLITATANPIPQDTTDSHMCTSDSIENRLSEENNDSPTQDLFQRSTKACPAIIDEPSSPPLMKKLGRPSVNYCPHSFYNKHVSCGAEVLPRLPPNDFAVVLNCVPGTTPIIPPRTPWPEPSTNPNIAQYCCAVFVDDAPFYAGGVCTKVISGSVQQFTTEQYQLWYQYGTIPWLSPS